MKFLSTAFVMGMAIFALGCPSSSDAPASNEEGAKVDTAAKDGGHEGHDHGDAKDGHGHADHHDGAADAKDHDCGPNCANCKKMKDVDPATIKAQPGAAVGDVVKCPVSDEVFTIAADTPIVKVGEADWYVCCDPCKTKMEADPAKFTTS